MINIAVAGCTGRMGRLVLEQINESPNLVIAGALARDENPLIDQDVGSLIGLTPLNIFITDQPKEAFINADVIIEFSTPDALESHVKTALDFEIPFLSCVTGLSEKHHQLLQNASKRIPVLFAPNTSLGIVVLRKLAQLAAKALGPNYDINILDIHHRHKKDSPSGTALMLKDSFDSSRPLECTSLRAGGVYGDHTISFAGENEVINIEHRALNRKLFAQGALDAAKWLKDKKPGLYSMEDVVEITL